MYYDSNMVQWPRFLNFEFLHIFNIIILCVLQNLIAFPVELLVSNTFNEQNLYSAFEKVDSF